MRPHLGPGLNLDEHVFGACELALEDFSRAVRDEPRTQRLIRNAMWVGALTCLAAVALMASGRGGTGLGVLVLGVLCFAAHNAPEQIAQRWFARTPREARRVKITISPLALIVTSEAAPQMYAWASLQGYHQTRDAFLVWVTERLFLILPKRAFSASDVPKVEALFEAQLGAPPELPRFWSLLLAAMALAALGLLLWNGLAPR